MAQHYRTLISTPDVNRDEEYCMEFHQCSVTDIIAIDGLIDISDAPFAAAAILEMYRFRGYSVDELLDTVKKIIQHWDDTGNNS